MFGVLRTRLLRETCRVHPPQVFGHAVTRKHELEASKLPGSTFSLHASLDLSHPHTSRFHSHRTRDWYDVITNLLMPTVAYIAHNHRFRVATPIGSRSTDAAYTRDPVKRAP